MFADALVPADSFCGRFVLHRICFGTKVVCHLLFAVMSVFMLLILNREAIKMAKKKNRTEIIGGCRYGNGKRVV